MSLQSRLATLITAIGTDIKSLQTQIDSLSGASGGSKQVEIDFGTVAKKSYSGTFADAVVTAGQRVRISQAGDAPTGRQADENEMEHFVANARVATNGVITVNVQALSGSNLQGKFKLNYAVG